MAENIRNLSHVILPRIQSVSDYEKRKMAIDKDSLWQPDIPHRTPSSHGKKLLSELNEIFSSNNQEDLPETAIITFCGEKGKDFLYESLDNKTLGIKLLSIKDEKDGKDLLTTANVQFLNKKSFEKFSKELDKYSNSLLKTKTRKNTIECTTAIKSSSLQNLFFDDANLFPQNPSEVIWWELMIDGVKMGSIFTNLAKSLEIEHDEGFQISEDRFVVLVQANTNQLLELRKKYPYIAEIRIHKKIAPRSVVDFSREEQEALKNNILSRIKHGEKVNTGVVIFDSGINQGHPLIEPFLREDDNKTCKDEWGSADHLNEPHGTLMSGLVLYGNINDLVDSSDDIRIGTILKGVKIFNPNDQHDKKSYPSVMAKAFKLSECQKNKAYVVAVTSVDSTGNPSAWSGSIDKIAFENKSLFLVSVGNIRSQLKEDGTKVNSNEYPDFQKINCVEDPSQSWNAISVGAYTDIADQNLIESDRYYPYANSGDLSPYSRTSVKFQDKWPIKPEVLFEGGNKVVDKNDLSMWQTPSLHPVSCEAHFQSGNNKLFCDANATSAATALAGKFAWELMAEYPSFWPETIRGLMVHSAEWTDAMLDKFPYNSTTKTLLVNEGLRCFGYGVPNLAKAKHSAKNSLTLIAQHEFKLYQNHQDPKKKNRVPQTIEFPLPWPKEVLENELKDKDLKVKITLSYFIEPNVSSRGYEKNKYKYQSYGLRFELKNPEESEDEFRKRFNQKARDEGDGKAEKQTLEWVYGTNSRNKGGSVHKDILRNITGAKLASMNKIAIYPTKGWWQENKTKQTEDMKVRFSLLVDVETEEVDVDLYAKIQNEIKNLVKIHTKVEV